MGPARLDWRDIPVRTACDTNHLPVGLGPLRLHRGPARQYQRADHAGRAKDSDRN